MNALVSLWRDLAMGRGAGSTGPAPLTWADLRAYEDRPGVLPIDADQARAVLLLDRSYLSEAMKK